MNIIKPEVGTKLPLEFTAVKRWSSNDVEIVEIELKENQLIELHRLTCKVFFYVKEGQGYLLSENDRIWVKKGSIMVVEPNELRGWACEKDQNIGLLVIKLMK